MAHLDPTNIFQRWVMNDEEKQQGSILTITQKQHLQNILVNVAEEKVNLPRLPETVQREAELQGWIYCIQHLIELSNAAESAMVAGNKEVHISDSSGNF